MGIELDDVHLQYGVKRLTHTKGMSMISPTTDEGGTKTRNKDRGNQRNPIEMQKGMTDMRHVEHIWLLSFARISCTPQHKASM